MLVANMIRQCTSLQSTLSELEFHMPDVQLSWTNKHLTLRASGLDGYEWLEPTDQRLVEPLKLKTFSRRTINGTSNLLAVGDGLDVLEALSSQTTFFGCGIRLVYVDPPFNTNADVRQYSDSMTRSRWLSMIRDRLLALQPLLSEDASIWVHLDDAEVHRARLVMDEVFGESAFVASVVWQKKTTRDSRAAFSTNHDTILVYAPSGPKKWKTSRNLLVKDKTYLSNRDNDPRGPWSDAPFTAPGYRSAQQYEIKTPSGRVLNPPRGRSWYATEATYQSLLKDGRIWFPKDGDGSPRLKLFSPQLRGLVPFTVWGSVDTGTNDDAKRHLMSLFPDKEVFDTPKPELLLERILHIATNPGDLVVDIFGGSGTTAAVSQKMRRRWLLAERNICTVLDFALPRLNSVIEGTDLGGITAATSWVGGGSFDIVQVSPRLMKSEVADHSALLKRAFMNQQHRTQSATG